MNVAQFLEWVPCSWGEIETLRVDPLIPWPHDQISSFFDICHIRAMKLVEIAGWAEARKTPEIRRMGKRLA